MPENIIIRNTQCPGDLVVLTAAIRELCRAHPGRFSFGIDVSERSVFKHNPHVNLLQETGRVMVARYPAIHQSNQRRVHFLWSFLDYLNKELGASAKLTEFKPDLYLSEEEKEVSPLPGRKYWVMASGGKMDYTAKWWQPSRWQRVVTALRDRFEFVQVGGTGDPKHPHIHPALMHTTNLIGKTSLHELARLISHSEGVLCVVACLTHIAAAFNKPCVVVAGGREAWWWEGYTQESRLLSMRHGDPTWEPPLNDTFVPQHYLHTMNQLPCCMERGCWKAHVEQCPPDMRIQVPDMLKRLPRCMDLITPEHVIGAVLSYYEPRTAPPVKEFHTSFTEEVPVVSVAPAEVVLAAPHIAQLPRNHRVTLAIQCEPNQALLPCIDLHAELKHVADLAFLSPDPNPALENFCVVADLLFVQGPHYGEQLRCALQRCTTPFFITLPARWSTTEQSLQRILDAVETRLSNVGTLVYKKQVDDNFGNILPKEQCLKPLLRNQRSGYGYTVFYPGNRIVVGHTDFLRRVPLEQFEDPVLLGEMLRQGGATLVEVGANLLHP